MTEEVQIPGRHRQRKPIVIARLPSSLSDDEEKAETEEACLQKTPVPHQEEVTPDDAKPGPEPGLVEQEKEPSRLVRQTRDIWREQMISQDFEKATVVAESRVKKDHDTGSTKRESHDKVHKGSYGSHGLDNPTVTGQYGSAKCTHASPRKEFPTTKFRKVKREAASSSQRAASALPLIGTYFDFVDNDVGDDLPEEENPHLVEAELVDPEAECHSDEDKVLVTAVAAPMRGFNCKWYAIVLIALFIVVGVVVSVVMTKANTSTVESATGRNHVGSRWTNATTKGPDNVTDVYEQEHEPGRQNDSSAAAYSSAEYSAIFSANFRIETSKLLEGMICGVNATGLNVECLNGPIVLLQNTSTMSCEPSDNDDSIVECYTRQNGISLNTWDSVIFQCNATDVPNARVQLLKVSSSVCPVESQVQLGALYGEPDDQDFYYFISECGEDSQMRLAKSNAFCSSTSVRTASSGSWSYEVHSIEAHTGIVWKSVTDVCLVRQDMEESPSFNFSNLALAHAASSIFIDSSTNTSQAPTSVASAAPSPAFGGINIGSAGFSNEDTVYSARYMARFKHTLDVNCNGPAPDIALFCLTGQIEILGTSDDTIVCVGPLTMNGTTVTLCSITCAEEECDSVYIDRGLQHPDLYGSIEFTCSGLTVSDVQGSLFVPGNTNGSCSALSGSNGFNVMLASLGVNCNDEYIFDDGYMECTGGSPINLFDGDYECFTGAICGEESCSVTIDDMSVTADHFRFPGCIETNDGSIISDIDLPTSEPLPIGTYSAIFSANMRIQLSDLYDEEDCTTHASGLKFTCLNGAIDLLESPYIMSCQASDNAIECIEASGFTPVNEWVTFVYQCESNNAIPTTKAELFEVETSCSAESQLQLGVLCGDPGDQSFLYLDLFVECGEGNEFDIDNGNYSCTESVVVNTFASERESISPVKVFTDYRWSLITSDVCLTYRVG